MNLLARSLNLDSTLRASLSGAQAEAWREALVKAGGAMAALKSAARPPTACTLN